MKQEIPLFSIWRARSTAVTPVTSTQPRMATNPSLASIPAATIPGYARPEIPGGDLVVAHPSSRLDRHLHRVRDAADDVEIHRPAGEGAVQVHHVDPRRPVGREPPRHLERGVGEDRGVVLPPLAEADRLPPLDVDRGNHLERHLLPPLSRPGRGRGPSPRGRASRSWTGRRVRPPGSFRGGTGPPSGYLFPQRRRTRRRTASGRRRWTDPPAPRNRSGRSRNTTRTGCRGTRGDPW